MQRALAVFSFCAVLLIVGGHYAIHWNDIPHGKQYHAVGAIIALVPYGDAQQTHNPAERAKTDQGVRAIVRTPTDVFFEIAFRGESQPPGFANAIGALDYHECGSVGGRQVYCFDSFRMSGEGVKPLDANGKTIDVTIPPPPPVKKR